MTTQLLDSHIATTGTGAFRHHGCDDNNVPNCRTASAPAHVNSVKNILVPLNFAETSLEALQYAVLFARQFGAKITLAHFLQPALFFSDYPYPGPMGGEVFGTIEDQLRGIRRAHIPMDLQVDIVVRQCFVFDGIPDVAEEVQADLIIASAEAGLHLKQFFMRSTAETIIRRAPCPVFVVHEPSPSLCLHDESACDDAA